MRLLPAVLAAAASASAMLLAASGEMASAQDQDQCSAPSNVGYPLASLSTDGRTLTVSNGRWFDNCGSEITYAYQWMRIGGTGWFPIPESDEAQIPRTADEDGLTVRAEVTATNAYGSSGDVSNPVVIPHTPPAGCVAAPPANTVAPTISGEAQATGVLTTDNGTWSSCVSAIAGYTYQWFRNGSPVSGAVEQSYVVPEEDVGALISAEVRAWNQQGESTSASPAAQSIGPAPPPEAPHAINYQSNANLSTTIGCFGALLESSCDRIPDPGGLPSAEWAKNFGGKLFHSFSDIRGVRAGIRTPTRHDFFLPRGNAAIMRISAERGRSVAQAGFGRTDPFVPVNACGVTPNDGKLYAYYETLAPGAGSGGPVQQCEFLFRTQRGKANLYTVYRKLESAVGNDKSWQVNINGRRRTLRYLAFDSAAIAVAGGEIANEQRPPIAPPDGTVYGCYGCSATPLGVWKWQSTPAAGSGGWRNIALGDAEDITSANVGTRTDDRWQVSNEGPGAFSVYHRCYTDHRLGC